MVEPIPIVVACPKALTVVKFVLNKVKVPVLVPEIVGLAPFMSTVVALGNENTVFLTVANPLIAPRSKLFAAPKAFTEVAIVL